MAEQKKQDAAERADRERFAQRVLVASAIFLAVTALFLFLWHSVYVLFLLFAGVLLAILLRALADGVRYVTRLNHRWSLAIVLFVLLVALAGFWYLAAANLTKQFAELSERLPQAWEAFQGRLRESPIGRVVFDGVAPGTQPATAPAPAAPPAPGRGLSGEVLGRLGGFVVTVVDLLAAVVVIVFTGVYLAFDPQLYVRGAIRLVPPAHRLRAGAVLGAIGYTLKWWLIGQGITMVIIATATWLGLLALGVPLALILGVIAGLFNFIPNFGPLFSMVPATLLALTISPGKGIAVIAMFIVLQNIEGNVLTPLIQRKSVDLPPAVGIITQILLSILVGAIGLMLAWPLAAVAVLGVKMLYIEDVLGEEMPTPDDRPGVTEVREARREARNVAKEEKRT